MKDILNIFFITIIFSFIQSSKAVNSFTIDYESNQFMKDGKPFRYVSGSLHYFRVPSVLWRDRMLSYKAAGLNAIQTYIEWNSHEPEKGVFDFSGDNDLIEFLGLAQEIGFVVILRIGPFIDAERDMGGLPYWLLTINSTMKIRTYDKQYIKELDDWYGVLLPKLIPMLYKNGGPVITVQIENEYGSYGCDFQYNVYLRDKAIKYFGADVVLFTTDGYSDNSLKCGKIDNVFATVDFGTGVDPKDAFAVQHRHQEFGPNVNSEFYPGWLDHWEKPHQRVETKDICNSLDKMLSLNASVNVYVFHGGTSFGFTAGANINNKTYLPCPTSYDYDAPLTEAGDPTLKYFEMRNIIGKYVPLPKIRLPIIKPKMEIPFIPMKFVSTLFDLIHLKDSIQSEYPMTFEKLKQRNGFILYSTNITFNPSDPAVLTINGLADRALIFVDLEYRSTLSRTQNIFQTSLNIRNGSKLDILVENQGRLCFGSNITELKGITSNVTLGPIILKKWNQYKIFDNWSKKMSEIERNISNGKQIREIKSIPSFFMGQFTLPDVKEYPLDTFLRLDGWMKGIAFLNGFNLGRYWMVGPQITLYSPSHLFKPNPQINTLVILETEHSPCHLSNDRCFAQFVKNHVINGTTPYSLNHK